MKTPLLHLLLMVLFFASPLYAQKSEVYPKKEGRKWAFFNRNGTRVTNYIYDGALGFNQGLAAVKKEGKWGYINETGTMIIPCKYDSAWYFTEDLAAVKYFGQWGYIDKQGNVIINFQFDDAGDFSGGMAWVQQVKKVGFIDTKGSTKIEFIYNAATSYSENLAGVQRGGKWGFISLIGAPSIDFQFDEVRPFSDGLAAVKKDGKWGYIDKRGKLLVDYAFYSPLEDTQTLEFGWNYAAKAYDLCGSKITKIDHAKNLEHLDKATKIIEKKGSSFTIDELEKLKKYYEMLGNTAKVNEIKAKIKEKKNGGSGCSTWSRPTADFSIAIAPFKLLKSMHQKTYYSELRLGRVGFGVRYNEYTDFKDKWRFGAWKEYGSESANVYSAKEYSVFIKLFKKSNIKRSRMLGYGHSGGYWGFEYRMGDFEFDPITTNITDKNTGTLVAQNQTISVKSKVQDVCLNVGYSHSRGLFFYDFGYSFGFGWRTLDFGYYDSKDYTLSDKRYTEDRFSKYYMPFRIYFRFGINLF